MTAERRQQARTYKFVSDLILMVDKAREAFPGNTNRLAALVEEVGEIATALQENQGEQRVWDECVDTACTALRLAVEGDAAYQPPPLQPTIRLGKIVIMPSDPGKLYLAHDDGGCRLVPQSAVEDLIEKYFQEKS